MRFHGLLFLLNRCFMKQEFDSPQLWFLYTILLQHLSVLNIGAYCLYLSIVASSKRILGHNIYVLSCFLVNL